MHLELCPPLGQYLPKRYVSQGGSTMKYFCFLIAAGAFLVACEHNTPAETLDPPGTDHVHPKPTNVGSTPLE